MQKYTYKNNQLNVEINCYLDKEIALLLDYNNTLQTIRLNAHEEDKKMMGPYSSPLNNHKYNFIFINESGLYSLISNSKKPEAKKFKHWVTSEVLPSIRKQGYYKLFNNYHKNNMFLIESENDLHHKVVSFIRKKYNDICLMVAGLGEFQTTSIKRISCWKKGYMKGQPD